MHDHHTSPEAETMRLHEFYLSNYKTSRLHGKSKNTFRLYEICIRHFSRSLGREPMLSDLNDKTIRSHLQRLLDEGRSKATVNKERCSLVAMWRYACKLKLIEDWPDIPKESEPHRTPRAWKHDDVSALLAACQRAPGLIGACPAWLFWTTLVNLCLETGERIGAVLQCEWTWLEGDSINVLAEARKGAKRDKLHRLSPYTVSLIGQMKRYKESKQIFHWPYSYTYIWNRYRKLLESAGLPTGRGFAMHRLRKTCASVAYAAGLDPQEILDHTDRRTTQRYLDPSFTRQTQPAEILAAWLRTPPAKDQRKQA